MAGIVAKQPDGLYCRVSTVVDAPTSWNMTKQDYIDLRVEKAKKDAEYVIENYCRDFDCALSHIKNGKKIFEGDIVRLYGDENNPDTKMIDYNALVIFKSGRFCAVDGTEDNHSFEGLILNSYLNCEVIGNKYDNPELLEV